jgi:hypothetical protein
LIESIFLLLFFVLSLSRLIIIIIFLTSFTYVAVRFWSKIWKNGGGKKNRNSVRNNKGNLPVCIRSSCSWVC